MKYKLRKLHTHGLLNGTEFGDVEWHNGGFLRYFTEFSRS